MFIIDIMFYHIKNEFVITVKIKKTIYEEKV